MPKHWPPTRLRSLLGAFLSAWCAGEAALAQQTTENVTTQSDDAFGRTVSGESTGLYGVDDVRGFNPIDAGNARIQGLYFDQIDRIPSKVLDSSTILVGFSAQGFPFPAPTGLVDYALTTPGEESILSIDSESGAYFSPNLSLEWLVPLDGAKLGISGGVAGRQNRRPEGGRHSTRTWGSTLAFRPKAGAEFLLFGAGMRVRSEEAKPTLFPDGDFLPPRVERGEFFGQPWTERERDSTIFGAVATYPLGDFRIEGGLFRAERKLGSTFADLLQGVQPDGTVDRRVIVADGNNRERSWSGELRLGRAWQTGSFAHLISIGLRGRAKERLYGGSDRLDLGASSAVEADFRPEPDYELGPENDDRVRQVTGGAAYSLGWNEVATLDLGLSKTRYRKRVDFIDPLAPDPEARSAPWLWNASATLALSPAITVYAGAARGQEEALIAPDIAVNRSESPPAVLTSQVEGGVMFKTAPVTVIASAFEISKPYYNLDRDLRYRQLGEISNRGIEVSLIARPLAGWTVVAGTVLLDPRISGESVEDGRIGPLPVGQVRRRSVVNVDWRLGNGSGPLSFDLAGRSFSSRVANAGNTLFAPGFSTFDVGARYRFSLADASWLLRLQILNVFDSYGWDVSSSGGFSYSDGRTALIGIVADF